VTIPSTIEGLPVTAIGAWAFNNWPALTNITIPHTVTDIGDHAFASCPGLPTITLPNSLTNLGEGAFASCSGLSSITIPATVTSIGSQAFVGCTSMQAITADALNSVYSSAAGVLFTSNQTVLVQYPPGRGGAYTVPNGVRIIGDYSFASCSSLTNVVIPEGVTWIGYYALAFCTGLTGLTIPDSATVIAGFAFFNCSGLISASVGPGVTTLYYTFYGCSGLQRVYFKGNAPTATPSVLDGCPSATVYYLPGTTGWSSSFARRPAFLWNPQVQTSDGSFGVRTNRFGFTITGTTSIPIAVEASPDLASPSWVLLTSCILTNGSVYFSDPDWTNYPARFYRIRSP